MTEEKKSFWTLWWLYMGMIGLYLYHTRVIQQRNLRILREYEAYIRESDAQMALLEQGTETKIA